MERVTCAVGSFAASATGIALGPGRDFCERAEPNEAGARYIAAKPTATTWKGSFIRALEMSQRFFEAAPTLDSGRVGTVIGPQCRAIAASLCLLIIHQLSGSSLGCVSFATSRKLG